MGGFSGFNHADKSLLKKMCDLIIHRGPDDVGYYFNSGISLGVRIQSNKDSLTEKYPLHNEEEDIWIILDGEIYNSLKLKNLLKGAGHKFYTNSAAEVIIHAYEEWGYNCLNKLRGPFSFCIYDIRKQILFLVRDPLGRKPLYYYFDGEKFIFGSEIKCILSHNVEREVNKRAFNFYLSLGYVPFNLTLFKGIKKLPPSRYLIFNLKSKDITIKKYWDLNFNIKRDKTPNQLAKELKQIIEESVKIRLQNDAPIGFFLSGGLDSSIVVGITSKLMNEPVNTISIGFEEGAQVNETKYAKIVADYNNTNHNEYIVESAAFNVIPKLVWHLDDLIADPGIIPVFFLAKIAKEKFSIVLTGDGADEIFAGFSHYYRPKIPKLSKFLPKKAYDFFMSFYNFIPSYRFRMALYNLNHFNTEEEGFIRALLRISDIEKSKVVPFDTENVSSIIKSKFFNNLEIVNQYTNWDLNYRFSNLYAIKGDRALSAVSLIGRRPFLDRNVINMALSIPPELKLKGTTEKYILRLAMKDILPSEILKKRKQGIGTPTQLWFKTGMREISQELLERLEKRGNLLKPKFVKRIRKYRNKISHSDMAWSLIMFELWYETFIEKDGLKPLNF